MDVGVRVWDVKIEHSTRRRADNASAPRLLLSLLRGMGECEHVYCISEKPNRCEKEK